MDKAAEKICKSCYECQLVAYPYPLELLTSMILPKGPQPDQAIDLLQPLPSGPSILLVINYYGHYHEYVEVIDNLEEILSSHDLPVTTKSDCNANQDNSKNTASRMALCILRPHQNHRRPVGNLKDKMPS